MSSDICPSPTWVERAAACSSSSAVRHPRRLRIAYCSIGSSLVACMSKADRTAAEPGSNREDSLSFDDAQEPGLGSRFGARGDAELAQDRRHVVPHGLLGENQLPGDLRVALALDQQLEH